MSTSHPNDREADDAGRELDDALLPEEALLSEGPDTDAGFFKDGSGMPLTVGADGLDELEEPISPAPSTGDVGHSVRAVVGKAALVIVSATLLGRVLGLVRDVLVAYFFGAQADTDAFFLAYRIPYLLTLMVAGALTATFVPLLTFRLATGRRKEAWDLSVNVGNVICIILIAVTVVMIIFAPWIIPLVGFGFDDATADQAVFLFRILMTGFVFEGLTGLLIGMLNSLKRFALAAFAPAVGTVVVLIIMVAFAEQPSASRPWP